MNAQDKVRVAIHNFKELEKALKNAETELVVAKRKASELHSELTRVMHSALGPAKAKTGVVFAGEKWWLDSCGVLQREQFTAEIL